MATPPGSVSWSEWESGFNWGGTPPEELEYRYGRRGANLSARRSSGLNDSSAQIWCGFREQAPELVSWFLELQPDEEEASREANLESTDTRRSYVAQIDVLARDFRNDWSVCNSAGEWESLVDLLESTPAPVTIVVALPWVPPLAALSAGEADHIDSLWSKGKRFSFISPAAFSLLVSFCVRQFMVDDSFIYSVFHEGVELGWRRSITVDDVREFLVEEAAEKVPRSIRETLLKYMEIADPDAV